MENNAVSVINALCDKFGIAIDWTSQNAIPYLQHLMDSAVRMKIATNISMIFIFLFSAIAFLFVAKKIKENENFDWESNAGILEFSYLGAMILYVVCILGAFLYVLFSVNSIVSSITFPEKVFMDMVLDYM